MPNNHLRQQFGHKAPALHGWRKAGRESHRGERIWYGRTLGPVKASSLASVPLSSPNVRFKVWYGACHAAKFGGKQGLPALAMGASLNRLSAKGMFVCSQEKFTIVYLAERSLLSGEISPRELCHSVINMLNDSLLREARRRKGSWRAYN